jgi:hypothetical protein
MASIQLLALIAANLSAVSDVAVNNNNVSINIDNLLTHQLAHVYLNVDICCGKKMLISRGYNFFSSPQQWLRACVCCNWYDVFFFSVGPARKIQWR